MSAITLVQRLPYSMLYFQLAGNILLVAEGSSNYTSI